MKRVSGENVWEALQKDPAFLAEVPEEQRSILEPYVRALPEILADLLDEPVTLVTILKAKAAYMRYCLDNEFSLRAAEATSEGQLFSMTRGELVVMMEALTEMALQGLEAVIEDVPSFLQRVGVTEEQMVLSFKPRLSPKNLRKYTSGKLTIGDILLSQLMIIIKNTDRGESNGT